MDRLQRVLKVPSSSRTYAMPPGHPGGEIAAGHAEHDHRTSGHVLAAVVAHTLDHREAAGVADAEALARHAAEEGLAGDGAVHHGIADDDVLAGLAAELR